MRATHVLAFCVCASCGWGLAAASNPPEVAAVQAHCHLGPVRPEAVQHTQRLGIGEPVEAARLARWDIDVAPNGEGLPAGSGTVAQGADLYAMLCAACHGAKR